MAVSLEKIEKQAPELVSLVKEAKISLEKVNMQAEEARVTLALDHSGSMGWLFRTGATQKLCNKMLALATQFDDDGSIDLFQFDHRAKYVGGMDLENFRDYLQKQCKEPDGGTDYGVVIKVMLDHFFPKRTPFVAPKQSFSEKLLGFFGKKAAAPQEAPQEPKVTPVFCIFVTDGDAGDNYSQLLQEAQEKGLPLFVQFMGLGGRFERLSEAIKGLGNCSLFTVNNVDSMTSQQLFNALVEDYSKWVTRMKASGVLQ